MKNFYFLKSCYYLLIIMMLLPFLFNVHDVKAHTYLEQSDPADGEVVEKSIQEIELVFSSDVQHYNLIEVIDEDDQVIDIEEIDHEIKRNIVVVFDEALTNGNYTVVWDVVSKDGHIANGQFTFDVQNESTTEDDLTEDTTENMTDITDGAADEEAEDKNAREGAIAEGDDHQLWIFTTLVALMLLSVCIVAWWIMRRR